VQTLAASQTIRKSPTSFYAHLNDQGGALCKIADVLYFVGEDAAITVITPAHVPALVVLGAMQDADAQQLLDRQQGGYAAIACTRANEER
jgi:hypothetical protein